ncbi:hypothetical protein GW17_00054218 [Ensete ventricosum]|nr:hypothetical protein GW17_00054218 [Ensete ventricosum]
MAPANLRYQRVFTFGKGKSEGNKNMKALVSICVLGLYLRDACDDGWVVQLGGKGANLAEMASIGLSVPPGLTVSTEACQEYQECGHKLPAGLWEEILEALAAVEADMGARLGDPARPLLVSVRSGAAVITKPSHELVSYVAQMVALVDGSNALLGAGVDAWDDGHGPQPGPQRRGGGGAGDQERRPDAFGAVFEARNVTAMWTEVGRSYPFRKRPIKTDSSPI